MSDEKRIMYMKKMQQKFSGPREISSELLMSSF